MNKPDKPVQSPDNVLPAEAWRLLEQLAGPGHYAWRPDGAPASRLAVTGVRNGVSVQVATGTVRAGELLVGAGLADWNCTGSRARLVITVAGRAKLARRDGTREADPFSSPQTLVRRRRIARDGLSVDVSVNVQESPLAWLAARKGRGGQPLVEPWLLEAGERLRRDMTSGGVLPVVTASWSAVASRDPSSAGLTYSDIVVAARQRVNQALTAVGPEFSGILVDVCGFLKGLETIEADRNWPARSARVVLTLALGRLARHYGYRPPGRAISTPGVRHWGAGDYRPEIGIVAPVGENATQS